MTREWKWVGLIFTLATFWTVGVNKWEQAQNEQAQMRRVNDKRIQRIGLAIVRYTKRHHRVMPDMSSAEAMRKDITPYLDKDALEGGRVFLAADTQEPFQPDKMFSKMFLAADTQEPFPSDAESSKLHPMSLVNFEGAVMLHQASPSPNMTRAVVYGNGQFRRVPEDKWFESKYNPLGPPSIFTGMRNTEARAKSKPFSWSHKATQTQHFQRDT